MVQYEAIMSLTKLTTSSLLILVIMLMYIVLMYSQLLTDWSTITNFMLSSVPWPISNHLVRLMTSRL